MSAHRAGRGAGGVGAAVTPSSRVTPFWILQLAEILSVLALADLSLHVRRGGVLAVAGAVFAALALTADGPLGVIRIFGRKFHVWLVVVVAVVVAVSPVISSIRPDVEGIIILELVAVGIIRLATLVNTDLRSTRPKGIRGSSPVLDATATVAPPSPTRPVSSATPGRSSLPTEESVGTAARWAGRAAGAASSAASRTSAKHGPATKAQAKRTIRTAGRLVGRARAASQTEGPDSEPG